MGTEHHPFYNVADLVQDALDGGFSRHYVVPLLSSRSNLRTHQTFEGLRAGVASPALKKDKRWVIAFKRAPWALYCTQRACSCPTERSPGASATLESRVSQKARASLAATGAVRVRKPTLVSRFAAARAKKGKAMHGMAAVVWVDNWNKHR